MSERRIEAAGVDGYNPSLTTSFECVRLAQLAERLPYTQNVGSSILSSDTSFDGA
jgi:hypothetical protein